ncbi:MAG: hypothetical protein PUC59_10340 [Firmicutes bacterium]|nr:hypothetical protein [Bacillota bacterium]
MAFGATDYNTAVRQATKNLADKGVRVIDYDSGTHTSAEAAVRRNIMSGLGSMNEKISEQNHDDMGANGWEISAHAASAPDHELIQGRQYTDAAYQQLNNSLVRRIGTLNCGHAAFPIVIGVSEPQYTDEELDQMREENAKGIDYQGRHYSTYEATQMQRKIERTIRKQKNRILVDEATCDADKLQMDQIRLRRLNDEYKRFSKAADLPLQRDRAQVAGFGKKQSEQIRTVRKKFIGSVNWELKYQNKNDIIQTENEPMYRKRQVGKIEPMPKKQFQKIEKRFKTNGGVFQYGEETDRYLESKHAEAITYNAKTILFKRHPGRASVFEELIHATQYRTGENDGSYLCRLQCEIAAQKKLLKYSKAYSLTAPEIEQTKIALAAYENDLKAYLDKGGD